MIFFYINSEVDLQGRVMGDAPNNHFQVWVMPPPATKNIFIFYSKIC